jgi:hypothetical protein
MVLTRLTCFEIRLRLTQRVFGAVAGLLNAPFYLHQPGNQQCRSQEDCKSQVGSRLGG